LNTWWDGVSYKQMEGFGGGGRNGNRARSIRFEGRGRGKHPLLFKGVLASLTNLTGTRRCGSGKELGGEEAVFYQRQREIGDVPQLENALSGSPVR